MIQISMMALLALQDGLSVKEFERLHKDLQLRNKAWATLPWKYSVTEARLQAAREKKPVFMVVNTGNALGSV